MGYVLHGCARATPCLRAELRATQERTRTLAVSYGLSPKTVKKRRIQTTTADAPMGPKTPKSTVLRRQLGRGFPTQPRHLAAQ